MIDTVRISVDPENSDPTTFQPRKLRFVIDGPMPRRALMARLDQNMSFLALVREMGRCDFTYVGPDPFDGGFLFQAT